MLDSYKGKNQNYSIGQMNTQNENHF